jgi:hypothetical protein
MALGIKQLDRSAACLVSYTRGNSPEALEQHAVRCIDGGALAFMHAGLISCLHKVMLEVGVAASAILTETRGMHGCMDHSRSLDIVVLDCAATGKHLFLDGVVTSTYKSTRPRGTGSIPGYAVKLVEHRKYYADKKSERPMSICHVDATQ